MLPIPHPRICKTLMVTSKKFKKSKKIMLSSYSRYFCLKLSDTWPLLDIKERHTRIKEGKKQKKYRGVVTHCSFKKILFTVSKSSVSPLQLCSKPNSCCGLWCKTYGRWRITFSFEVFSLSQYMHWRVPFKNPRYASIRTGHICTPGTSLSHSRAAIYPQFEQLYAMIS